MTCSVCTPEGAELDVDVVENEDGTFDIFYTAPQPGEYVICVRFGGEHIPNSPFQVTVSVGDRPLGYAESRAGGAVGAAAINLNCCVLSPPPVTTRQALEGAPSEQLLQQSQVPQYYAPQPWVPRTSSVHFLSGLSLIPSCLIFQLLISIHPFVNSALCPRTGELHSVRKVEAS